MRYSSEAREEEEYCRSDKKRGSGTFCTELLYGHRKGKAYFLGKVYCTCTRTCVTDRMTPVFCVLALLSATFVSVHKECMLIGYACNNRGMGYLAVATKNKNLLALEYSLQQENINYVTSSLTAFAVKVKNREYRYVPYSTVHTDSMALL